MREHSSEGRRGLSGLQRRLIEAAIRAPSGDNCQPWCFRFNGESCLQIYPVLERAKSFFDYNHCATGLSIGAVIENIRTQAASEGLGLEVTYENAIEAERPAAILRLFPENNVHVDAETVMAMYERTVNRRPFLPWPPPYAVRNELFSHLVAGTRVYFIRNRREISRWARVIEIADRIRFSHPVIHQELFSKILFTEEMAQRMRMGLEIERLGMGPMARPFLQFLQPWERVSKLSRWGLIRLLAGQSRMLARMTGALVVVSIPQGTIENWMRAGEQVQRLWIRAHERGMAVHPMTVAFYLDLRYQEEGMQAFLPSHGKLLQELRGRLKELLPEGIGTMLFRLGKSRRLPRPAIRLAIDQFLMS